MTEGPRLLSLRHILQHIWWSASHFILLGDSIQGCHSRHYLQSTGTAPGGTLSMAVGSRTCPLALAVCNPALTTARDSARVLWRLARLFVWIVDVPSEGGEAGLLWRIAFLEPALVACATKKGPRMTLGAGFTCVTEERVVDVGELETTMDNQHTAIWQPCVGIGAMVIGGVVLIPGRTK